MGRKRREWQPLAACQTAPTEIFFPGKGRAKKNPAYKQYCDSCPVRKDCLEYAIVHNEEGTWGGTTEAERKNLPRLVQMQLIQEAKAQGWYESRVQAREVTSIVDVEYSGESPGAAPRETLESPIFLWDSCTDSIEYQFSLTA